MRAMIAVPLLTIALGCGNKPTAPEIKVPVLQKVTGASIESNTGYDLHLTEYGATRQNRIEGVVRNVSDPPRTMVNVIVYGKVYDEEGKLRGNNQATIGLWTRDAVYLPAGEEGFFSLYFSHNLEIDSYTLEFYEQRDGDIFNIQNPDTTSAPVDTTSAPTDTTAALGKRVISLEGSTVSFTNTSGGDTLIAGKYAILHFEMVMKEGSDVYTFEQESPNLGISLNCPGGSISQPIYLNDLGLYPVSLPDFVRGSACSGSFWSYDKNWTILDAHFAVANEIVNLPAATITFYPVVVDSGQIHDETILLSALIHADSGLKHSISKSLPLELAEYGVGESVVVDTTLDSFEGDIARAAFSGLREKAGSNWGRLDFHIGIVSPRIHNGLRAGYGYAGGRGGLISINWARGIMTYMTVEHEIGHVLGLRHVNCGNAHNLDENYPDPNGYLDTDGYQIISGASYPIVKRADSHFDFMGYCYREWVSKYHYNKMLDYVLDRPSEVAGRAAEDEVFVCRF